MGKTSRHQTLADTESDSGGIRVLIVGTGLIGTSIALALRGRGIDVLLEDCSQQQLAEAVALDAGRPLGAEAASILHRIDHVIVAVPPRDVGAVMNLWQHRLSSATFSDTASVKARPLADAEAMGCEMSRICGGHPIAGGQRSGPAWASADLFVRRPWVLTPNPQTSDLARRHSRIVAVACGASIVEMDAESHDTALGLLSHLPHLVASAFAAQLALAPDHVLRLAGPGLWDFTRIAGANADLWTDIVAANAAPIASMLTEVVADLGRVRDALLGDQDGQTAERHLPDSVRTVVDDLFRVGNVGRGRLETARVPVLTDLVIDHEEAPPGMATHPPAAKTQGAEVA